MTEIIYREPTKEEIAEAEAWAAEAHIRARQLVEDTRLSQYQLLADPLFFGWQRGDNTEAEWLDAVQAVKDANPYPQAPSAKK